MRVTDDERREAASNLRLLEPSVFDEGEFYDSWEVLDAIDVASSDGAWYEAAGVRRLADLIEPSCDRDALLELAEELESKSHLICDRCGCETSVCRTCALWVCSTTARRIRLACRAKVGE